MAKPIYYRDRVSGKVERESVYGQTALSLLYNDNPFSHLLSTFAAHCTPLSRLYGSLQKSPCSKKKILPFIQKYGVDAQEFLLSPENFTSFNDFFCRKLKPSARPLAAADALIPADGRFLVYPNLHERSEFIVKDQKFCLKKLIANDSLSSAYEQGSMLIGRLAPVDYHRFHFPCEGIPTPARLINGPLFSVNPIAIQKNLSIFTQNKRMITEFTTTTFGKVLYIEIGATNVGSIHQTYTPNQKCARGEEKGYFSFGGSALILLFPPNNITFDDDLVTASRDHLETLCRFGQSLGHRLCS